MNNFEELARFYLRAFLITSCIVFGAICLAHAEPTIDIYRLCDAIGKAENSVKYPYGIKSIPTYGNKEYARKICLNTIKNHLKRHAKHNCGREFISCLGARYCPTTIKAEFNLNRNWIKNVTFFYNQAENNN